MKDEEITVADDLLFDTADKLKRLDEADLTDDRERTRRELAIYHGYFDTLAKVVQNPHADGKNETARAFVGRHIHPGYAIMLGAIPLYTNNAAIIPTKERIDLFSAFDELMLVIYARWNDCANAALNVRACFDDVSDKTATLDDVQAMTKEAAAQFMADMDGLSQRLRQRLIELSAVMMNAPESDTSGKILAAVQDVGHKVDAAREDLELTKNGVQLLADRALKRSKKAREAQANATGDPDIAAEKKRADDDMARAVRRVREAMLKNPKQTRLDVCRRVCQKFTPLTTKRNAMGDFTEYAPLYDWTGQQEIKPDTLAKNYRNKYGTKKSQKTTGGARSKPPTVTKPPTAAK